MNDYTLHKISLDRQRDLLREREQDRLARQTEAERQNSPSEQKKRASLQELFASYLPKKIASKTR